MAALVGFVTCVTLAGCSRAADEPGTKASGTEVMIDCALHGASAFGRSCSVERTQGSQGEQLVVRHPGGGFRRFEVVSDGRGLATADGAQAAQVAVQSGGVEVAVGDDRYRFPATVVNHERH